MDSLTSYQSTIEDIFQGQDAIITNDAYVDDTQDLMLQAEALFEDQSPLIEQMLSMQQQIGDGSAESQMIMFIDDNVPDYAVLQSPMSDTKILNNNDHQRPKIEQMATDEPEWLAQSEFFIGALIVFLSFPLLLNTESRKFKNYMIVQDVLDLRDKGHIVYLQGPTKTLEEYLYDPLTGINARNVLKLYRKVEQLITNHYGEKKWIEREYDIQWFDSIGNHAEQSIFKSQVYYNKCMISNYVMNSDQIEKLDNWTKISINQLYVPDFQVENNNIYINSGDTQLRIQYFVVHSQLLSIVCKSYGNELCPLDIHIPIIDTTCIDDTAQTSTRQDIINYKGCQEELCVKVCQWINWNEWSQDNQHIDYVEEGLLSLEEMFQKRLTYNNTKVGLIRLTSFCLMVVGIWMFFLPIYQVLYLFPIFGQLEIGPMIGMVVGVIFAAVFCLITIGVSYWQIYIYQLEIKSFYKKYTGIFLISLGVLICLALIVCSHMDFQIQSND
ncbi:hypothetical protein pb186bvf_007864 [Paramecium bursaria]